MDVLARESEKLALLQANILLLPGSLNFKEFPSSPTSLGATHQLELSLKYALEEVKILVTLAKPLDFTILTPDLLPVASLLGIVEIEDDTSLVDLVKMLVKALQKHHSCLLEGTKLEHLPGDIAHLTQVFPTMRHELAMVDDNLTLILCFKSEEKVSICSVNNLLRANKLVNTADHCFNIKMEFKGGNFQPAGFKVQWSPDLTAMLPELADVRLPSLKSESVPEFVNSSKEALQMKLNRAITAWEERSDVMLKLVDVFADMEGVMVNLDFDTMTGMDIAFRTRSKSHIYTVALYTGNKRGDCKVECNSKTEDGKKSISGVEFNAQELEKMDLGKFLINEIRKNINADSD